MNLVMLLSDCFKKRIPNLMAIYAFHRIIYFRTIYEQEANMLHQYQACINRERQGMRGMCEEKGTRHKARYLHYIRLIRVKAM